MIQRNSQLAKIFCHEIRKQFSSHLLISLLLKTFDRLHILQLGIAAVKIYLVFLDNRGVYEFHEAQLFKLKLDAIFTKDDAIIVVQYQVFVLNFIHTHKK